MDLRSKTVASGREAGAHGHRKSSDAGAGARPHESEEGSGREQRAPYILARRAKHFVRAAIVGLVAGLVGVAFRESLYRAELGRGQLLTWLHLHPYWGWAVLPIVGLVAGSAVGWAVRRYAPDAPGSGIPHVKGVLVRVRRMGWRTLIPVKFLGGVLGIGAGLSLGREGPTVQLGAAIGNALGDWLRVPKRTLPQLISCGAGAGLAAAFNAPLAGFIFVLEEMHRELSALTYGGALIAAVCATIVTEVISGQAPSFSVRSYASLPLVSLPLIAILGAVGGLVGVFFNQCLLRTLSAVHRLRFRALWLLPGIAGIAVGLAAWWIPDAIGGGHAVAERLLSGHLSATIGALALLFAAKLAFTVVSYASGAPGGIFAPMLLLGAVLGAIFGRLVAGIFPAMAAHQAAFAVLGMAAFFSASVRAPLTGIVLILEMTAKQEQLFALCVACMVAYLVAERFRDRPIYEALLELDLLRSGAVESRPEPNLTVISVSPGSEVDGKRIRDAGLPRGCLVVGVERGGRELLPDAELALMAGDHITVLTPGSHPRMTLIVVRMCQEV
ncbi:MAG: H(+)/Cl(-) exchange transporter ClcA [Phycisphaerae bacterium]